MAGPVKTEAIVLRSLRYGEADRILHLYTPRRGRVSAIAKGVRRARSRFGGRLEPFFRLQLDMHEGRGELLTITGAETIEAYPRLRSDARALDAAARACDAVGRLFETDEPHPNVYNLLCRRLALLEEGAGKTSRSVGVAEANGSVVAGNSPAAEANDSVGGSGGVTGSGGEGHGAPLPRSGSDRADALAFRLKLMLAAGLAPQLGVCVGCGEREHLVGFSGAAGGVVCGACEAASFPLDLDAYRFMTDALGLPLTEAPDASEQSLGQVERAIAETLEHHAHIRLMPAVGRSDRRAPV
jgi:DNA repair protein RecO (recombination protein O)